MSTDGQPIFVFVPGAWHTADTFDGLRKLMAEQGFETEAISTPSVGASAPEIGFHADIDYTKAVLQKLVDSGRQVVPVLHSYGGVVGQCAVEGLGYAQRLKAGLPGGVINVVWMAAFVAGKGQSLLDMTGAPLDAQETVFYNDMTPEDQQKAIAVLKPQPTLSFTQPATYESWHDIPAMYLFCDKDQGLPLAVQETFANILGTSVTFHVDASHSAFLSQPAQVIEGLRLALKTGREQSGASSGL